MPPEIDLWKQIATAGLPALLMAVAVWWLQKGNRELVVELNKERGERLDSMESHMSDCDADRKELRTELLRLALRHSKDDEDFPRDPPTRHHIPRT